MKKKLFLLFVPILFLACGPDGVVEKPIQKGSLELIIDNETYNFNSTDVSASVDDKGQILIVITYAKTENPSSNYTFAMQFDKGHFAFAQLGYVKNGKCYKTEDFNPAKTFLIKNYSYDSANKSISYNFEGILYEPETAININSNKISVKGKINLKNIISSNIPGFAINRVSYDTSNFSFYSVRGVNTQNEERTLFYHHFLSNDGYRLLLTLDPTVSSSLLPQTYSFDKNSTKNCVSFFKFSGEPRMTTTTIIEPHEWKGYQCNGFFTITQKTDTTLKGILFMEVYDNMTLLYKIDNVEFSILK